eukprot:CAMPEP_0117655496 /NCGR_PEP_ID=MMETSP0804-20121206/4308_1 /TAXON_ID=1074897 /ORGANISM="Tetraselmis astigmatica, Strain CCMP880" /LENGTH=153 /DNA_ID=CAMNT_0005461847 /DNA_START=311 /DNA_END=769 /DNA_ORIENTATION=-
MPACVATGRNRGKLLASIARSKRGLPHKAHVGVVMIAHGDRLLHIRSAQQPGQPLGRALDGGAAHRIVRHNVILNVLSLFILRNLSQTVCLHRLTLGARLLHELVNGDKSSWVLRFTGPNLCALGLPPVASPPRGESPQSPQLEYELEKELAS